MRKLMRRHSQLHSFSRRISNNAANEKYARKMFEIIGKTNISINFSARGKCKVAQTGPKAVCVHASKNNSVKPDA